MSEKPLHVRVAEALGYPSGAAPCDGSDWHFDSRMGSGSAFNAAFSTVWRDVFDYGDRWRCPHELNTIPRYDTSWQATGPLIERFRLLLRPLDDGGYMAEHYRGGVLIVARPGDTPCLAVCWLLLALADKFDISAAGKLPGGERGEG
jgi:hypothetical protein